MISTLHSSLNAVYLIITDKHRWNAMLQVSIMAQHQYYSALSDETLPVHTLDKYIFGCCGDHPEGNSVMSYLWLNKTTCAIQDFIGLYGLYMTEHSTAQCAGQRSSMA